MSKKFAKLSFSYIFLFILTAKMMISAMPAITTHFDSKSMNAVIMQLEIENNSSKNSTGKVLEAKGEWCDKIDYFSFHNSYRHFSDNIQFAEDDLASQPFFPSVPTPPPSI